MNSGDDFTTCKCLKLIRIDELENLLKNHCVFKENDFSFCENTDKIINKSEKAKHCEKCRIKIRKVIPQKVKKPKKKVFFEKNSEN